ncbi:glycosyltransferase family 2 protein [Sphingobacterium wenxiniae]|nr:glycosyltransferase family 2 protein [Sphingobacterium wenxiniae]
MGQPFFSIVIPVYNIEQYIKRCIDSVLEQTFDDYELLIVDDESKDSSISLVEEYTDKRIKILSKVNGGLSSARNFGLHHSKGAYVWFIDGDDYVCDKEGLQKIYDTIKSKTDSPDIVVFNNEVIYEGAEKKGWINVNAPEDTPLLSGVEYVERYGVVPINAWTQCYQREFFIKNGFCFKEGIYFEDIYINLDIYQVVKNVVGINEILIHYFKREGSIMTSRFNKQHLSSEVQVLNKFNYIRNEQLLPQDYLLHRMQYEFFFLKKIFKEQNNKVYGKGLQKSLRGISIPVISTDSFANRIEKFIFKYFPIFVLEYQYYFEKVSILEGRVKDKIRKFQFFS